jgi:DNA polymerase-1
MHPRYKPTQVVTGRLASEKPNIQQVPRKDSRVKKIFGGVPGMVWVRADLSQIELRIAAWVAKEERMIDAFQAGEDLHSLTAGRILGDPSARQVGKTLNFGLLYGAFPGKLVEVARNDYGVSMTKAEATKYRAAFFDAYPGLIAWHDRIKAELAATQLVASPLGRVRHFPEVASSDDEWVLRAAEREAINHPVQSFASDMLLHALVSLPSEIQQYAVVEVHDELGFIMPEDRVEEYAAEIKAEMEDVTWLRKWGIEFNIPVLAEVEYGPYWSN